MDWILADEFSNSSSKQFIVSSQVTSQVIRRHIKLKIDSDEMVIGGNYLF